MDWSRLIQPLTLAGLVGMMLAMGFRVSIAETVGAVRHLRQVLLSLLANFVLVPAVTIGLLRLFEAVPLVSVGFLVLAVCPGAPVGPPFAAIARGDVAYATGQMVLLAGLSVLAAPGLLSLWLQQLLPDSSLSVDPLAIVRTLLASQLLPLGAGLGIHAVAPQLADRLQRPFARMANVLLLVVIVLVLVRDYESLWLIRLRGWGGMLLLLAASLVIGWLCGGPARSTRRALAVTTACRNAAVALVIVSTRFSGTPAVTAVVAFALVSILGTLACALLMSRLPIPSGERPGPAPDAPGRPDCDHNLPDSPP